MEFKIDFKLIKKSSIVFTIVLLVIISATIGSTQIIGEMERELQSKENKLSEIKRLYRRTVSDQKLYSEYLVGFKEMENRGVVNGEKRLSWIESLQQINEKLKLPVLKHKLDPQQKVDLINDDSNTFSKLTINKTNMILTVGLFHELDLISIFDGLSASEGIYSIRWCGLTSAVKRGILSITEENINAECVIEWFSIDVIENNDANF